MAASQTAAPAPNTDGGNALALLFAAAAGSMHRQQQVKSQSKTTNSSQRAQNNHNHQQQQREKTPPPTNECPRKQKAKSGSSSSTSSSCSNSNSNSKDNKRNTSINSINNASANLLATLFDKQAKHEIVKTQSKEDQKSSTPKVVAASPSHAASANSTLNTSQKDLDAKRDTLCQLLNLKPELRNLESWHDEDSGQLDESCYQELVDPSNPNGWSAEDMFEYNEKMHKITSNYSEKTLSDNYTTPLPKVKSKSTFMIASQLAKEIEMRVREQGCITPESSDDDELFEQERIRRIQLNKQNQLKNLKLNQSTHGSNRFSPTAASTTTTSNGHHMNGSQLINSMVSNAMCCRSSKVTTKSSSRYSNYSTATPATASLSSSPTLNDSNTITKPVTSSSRNILRTCLI